MNKPLFFFSSRLAGQRASQDTGRLGVGWRGNAGPASCLAVLLTVFALGWGPAVLGQTLWRDDLSRSMFADKRATAVGDLLTVIVQENTSSSRKNNTTTSKKSSINSAIDTFLYSPGASGLMTQGGLMPAVKLAGNTSFSGGGQINNEERMTARFAVRVLDVLPNGSLIIEGKRQTKISGETTDAVLRGVVRQEDVSSANTVFSYEIADASIQYHSKGAVTDSQRKGWFLRLWDKFMPF
jgi:flagellar L-ring protein FlgH